MNYLANGGDYADFDGTILPGEGIMPIKSMKDLDKLEQKIAKDDKVAEKNGNLSTSVNTKTQADITKLKYWLKYCLMATLVNCMVPIYWGTGIIIGGAPIMLPIIYIPFVVIPGRTICVIGLGLCGIVPMPMLLFVNASNTNSTIILPLNIAIDLVVKLLGKMGQVNFSSLQLMLNPLIKALDREIQGSEDELLDLDYQRDEIKRLSIDTPRTEFLVKRELNKEEGVDPTSHRDDTPMTTTEYAQSNMFNMMDNVGYYNNDTWYDEYKAVPIKWNPTGYTAEEAGADDYYGELYTLADYRYEYPSDRRKNYSNVIVFLDPGHEYSSTHKDSTGKITPELHQKGSPRAMYPDQIQNGPAIEEWEATRKIAMMVESILYSLAPGINVCYTAPVSLTKDDTYTGLPRRKMNAVDMLVKNPSKHGVFVSIHLNAAGNGSHWYSGVGGWAQFISTNNSLQTNSIPLAESIYKYAQQYWPNKIRKHNNGEHWGTATTSGMSYSDYGILCMFTENHIGDPKTRAHYNEYWQKIPAVITENFFQDVLDDAEYIDANMQAIAEVNAYGILDFLDNKTTWVLNTEAYLNA